MRSINQARAPPLETHFPRREPPQPTDRARARRRVARWAGAWTGALWAGMLLGLLAGMGRVPWLEAWMWSLASAAVLARTVQTGTHRVLDHLLAECTLELGPEDPQAFQHRARRRALRYGYELEARLQGDTFRPRRAPALFPALHIAWSGPGAVLQGPRFLVRSLARLAVG